jgi:hypothetical protein
VPGSQMSIDFARQGDPGRVAQLGARPYLEILLLSLTPDDSEHWALPGNLAVPGAQPKPGPDATTWSYLLRPRG